MRSSKTSGVTTACSLLLRLLVQQVLSASYAPNTSHLPLLCTAPPRRPCPIQMQQWSQQRARLEEEIIRRQEASRYASPSLHAQGALAGPLLGGQAKAEGYMSPYAGLVSHQVGRVERNKQR